MRRGAWLDATVVVVVMGVLLSILDDTFANRSYLVAGLVPVVALVALALGVRNVPEGGWLYALAGLVVFSPLGALAALREPGPYLLPTLDAMGGLLADSIGAPVTLVSTVPPVDPTGEVMLVPYMIGFLATFPAAWLAIGTARPLAPAVPLALGLAATIPVGVLVPTLLVPRGIVVAIVLVAWGAVRARRREPIVGAASGTAASTVTAVVIIAVLACLVSLLVPDEDTTDRVLLRGDDVTPLVADASLTMPSTEQARYRVLMKAVGVPEGRRLRFAVLDVYDGREWVAGEESPGSEGYGTFKRIGSEVSPLHLGRTVVVRVRMQPGYDADWLPLLGELTSIDLGWNPGRTAVSDLRYNQATGTALVLGGVDPRDAYSFESVLDEDDTFTRRDATREPSDDQRQPLGVALDEALEPFARSELLPLERVLLLARYLRANGTTRKGIDAAQAPDDLVRLMDPRRMTGTGYEFTTLMALGSSRLGVPARVVTGAPVDRRDLVYNIDVESWVELQFADGTWRPLYPERYLGSRSAAPGSESDELAPAEDFVEDQLAAAADGKDREIRPPRGSTNPDGTATPDRPAWQLTAAAAGALVWLGVLALLQVPVVKAVRRRRRQRATSWSLRWVGAWQEVLDVARDRGTPVPEGWSRVMQATALGAGIDLARRADAAVFAPGTTDDNAEQFWQECQRLCNELLTAVARPRRWWAHLNPASLVAGWARRSAGRAHPPNGDLTAGGA
ncbi:transglutaminaseTgpA domain-containing protein [Nocardioides sp. GCM10028917]|uniref:transglutaminaseTgpA domain-containing protein n=1 Tax=Nocardioides sp. GCM10028917 TaxID=3273408 RepID=UPI00360C118A